MAPLFSIINFVLARTVVLLVSKALFCKIMRLFISSNEAAQKEELR